LHMTGHKVKDGEERKGNEGEMENDRLKSEGSVGAARQLEQNLGKGRATPEKSIIDPGRSLGTKRYAGRGMSRDKDRVVEEKMESSVSYPGSIMVK